MAIGVMALFIGFIVLVCSLLVSVGVMRIVS